MQARGALVRVLVDEPVQRPTDEIVVVDGEQPKAGLHRDGGQKQHHHQRADRVMSKEALRRSDQRGRARRRARRRDPAGSRAKREVDDPNSPHSTRHTIEHEHEQARSRDAGSASRRRWPRRYSAVNQRGGDERGRASSERGAWAGPTRAPTLARAVGRRLHQLLGLRKILWQPLQLPISSFQASGKVSASVILVSAALAAAPSFVKRPSKCGLVLPDLGKGLRFAAGLGVVGKSFGQHRRFLLDHLERRLDLGEIEFRFALEHGGRFLRGLAHGLVVLLPLFDHGQVLGRMAALAPTRIKAAGNSR